MIEVLDTTAARQALRHGALRCPACAEPLRPWGHARQRTVRGAAGAPISTRPDRARCTGCQATHVLLDARLLPHRAYSVQVIGAALLAAAHGRGHRRIAADLRAPHGTVRGWIRRARRSAHQLWTAGARAVVAFAPELLPAGERADPLTNAVEALAAAAAALAERLDLTEVDPWTRITLVTGGQLLTPVPAG